MNPQSPPTGLRRRGARSPSQDGKASSPLFASLEKEESKDATQEPDARYTTPPTRVDSVPFDAHQSHTRNRLTRLLGFGARARGAAPAKITPENIYVTANISAFASSLSLVALILGIITLMLTHERSLLSTMKTSYKFMKELSEGYHSGIQELQRKTGGPVDMKEQLSQFVQTMHALPWRELRENMDQKQLEELFRVLSDIPQTLDQVHDEIWSICVAFRRILGLPVDYCVPSARHPPSKVVVDFSFVEISKAELLRDHAQLMATLKGEYLEKGLVEVVTLWHRLRRDQTVSLLPSASHDVPEDAARAEYESLPARASIPPRAFEKLVIHPRNGRPHAQPVWDLMYATDLVLLSRHILHRDAHWHVDRVQIADLHTLASPDARMFNPTLVTADVRLVVSRLKLRDPVFDGFSEFHEFAAPAHLLADLTRLDDPAYADAIEFAYAASPFIRGQAHKLYKAKQAKQKRILMRRGAREWTVKLSSDAPHLECSFRSAMDKPLHQKASWRFCRDTEAEAPPVAYIDEVQVLAANDADRDAQVSGTYARSSDPFAVGYFAQWEPEPHLIFVRRSADGTALFRLFMAKAPDAQWHIQRFESAPLAINLCRLSLRRNETAAAARAHASLCSHVVPYKRWTPSGNAALRQMRALSVEFAYGGDRLKSVFLRYARHGQLGDENTLLLRPELLIKGNDLYFRLFTRKDDMQLERHYSQVVLDLTTFAVLPGLRDACQPPRGAETQLPTLHLLHYRGKVEAVGGLIRGNFTLLFYNRDDCRNLFHTIQRYSQPVSFL